MHVRPLAAALPVQRSKQLLKILGELEPCLIGIEASTVAFYWQRQFEKLGHTVKIITPQYVKLVEQRLRVFQIARVKPLGEPAVDLGEANASINREHIPTLEEDNARQGFVDHRAFVFLRSNLSAYLRDPITFLYLSGWRLGEVKALERRDVDLAGGVVHSRPEISKNKDGRLLPLSGELFEIMDRARAKRQPDCPFVFHRENGPVGDFRKAWSTPCKAAGLHPILVHYLRRTAVRNMVCAGIPDRQAHLTRAAEQLQAHLTVQSKLVKLSALASNRPGR
jgi:integrase